MTDTSPPPPFVRPPGPQRGRIPRDQDPTARGYLVTAADIERVYPHATQVIQRGHWLTYEQAGVNAALQKLGEYRLNNFNGITTIRFLEPEPADLFAEHALANGLHRLRANSHKGATREEVAIEWERREAEREEILAWGRTTGMLREVVQHYRFERSTGAWSYTAHLSAGRLIEKTHPTVVDPVNHAGVMIVWAEKEHRAWFWNGCRGNHHL